MDRDHNDLQPCPCCGAHRWSDQDVDLFIRNIVRCRECNYEARADELAYVTVHGGTGLTHG